MTEDRVIDINLIEEWHSRSDRRQWIVEKRLHGAKAKRHAWEPKAYCNSFDSALVFAGRRRVMETPGEYGPDALPLLATALDAILGEVDSARDAYRKSKDQAGAIHPPSTANRPDGELR